MPSKSLLVAMAAFAVTATGVHAYTGPKLLEQAGLNKDQIAALSQAHTLRAQGDVDAARDVLLDAGIDDEALLKLHQIAVENRAALHRAIQSNDYEAFVAAVQATALGSEVPTKAAFERLVAEKTGASVTPKKVKRHHRHLRQPFLTQEEHDALQVARQANDRATAEAILAEAGW